MLLAGYVGRPRPAVHAALGGPGGFDVDAPGALGHHQFAVEQNVEARRRLTLDTDRTRFKRGDVAVLAERLQLLVGQCLEQEQRPQLVRQTSVFGLAHH